MMGHEVKGTLFLKFALTIFTPCFLLVRYTFIYAVTHSQGFFGVLKKVLVVKPIIIYYYHLIIIFSVYHLLFRMIH